VAADSGIDRAYVSELERELANATIDLLDRLAVTLETTVGAFFVPPAPDAERPKPLRAGRRPRVP
jgi:transcriptional regulator with XRE-family HTH domain